RCPDAELRARADERDLLRGGMDATELRRADHPGGWHPTVAAREHRTSGPRHHGAARPRIHPGIDRRPNSLRPAARLSAAPGGFQGRRPARALHARVGVQGRVLSNLPKFMVSLLKAWYGDAATSENEFGYQWIPKLTGDHSHVSTSAAMADGKVKGFVVFGQNPANGSPHSGLQRRALTQLDWMVAIDLYETETAAF